MSTMSVTEILQNSGKFNEEGGQFRKINAMGIGEKLAAVDAIVEEVGGKPSVRESGAEHTYSDGFKTWFATVDVAAAKERAFWVNLAKMAEQAERYEEMVEYMNEIIKMGLKGDELEQDERNLISVGYKNMMSNRRTAWRVAQSKEEGRESDGPPDAQSMVGKYKDTIGKEVDEIIEKVMREVVKVYTSGPTAATKAEYLVFFHKMEGDYYRYGAEKSEGAQREEYKNKSKAAYVKARECGESNNLAPTNPIFLGLGLNQSVFYYEICQEHKEAKELAKQFFEQALDELDKLPEEQYKDATLIMQLLKENLTLWDDTGDDGEDELLVEDA